MTKPISQERTAWLRDRLKVVEASINVAQSTMYTMRGGGVASDVLHKVLMDLNAERTQISIELQVLRGLVVPEAHDCGVEF